MTMYAVLQVSCVKKHVCRPACHNVNATRFEFTLHQAHKEGCTKVVYLILSVNQNNTFTAAVHSQYKCPAGRETLCKKQFITGYYARMH